MAPPAETLKKASRPRNIIIKGNEGEYLVSFYPTALESKTATMFYFCSQVAKWVIWAMLTSIMLSAWAKWYNTSSQPQATHSLRVYQDMKIVSSIYSIEVSSFTNTILLSMMINSCIHTYTGMPVPVPVFLFAVFLLLVINAINFGVYNNASSWCLKFFIS